MNKLNSNKFKNKREAKEKKEEKKHLKLVRKQ
jgi:hypothetical protein